MNIERLKSWIPLLEWLPHYKKVNIKRDFFAGISISFMMVPQGMAYAMLAGLPPVVGLYASTIPLIGYFVFGSSKHLAVGPVAIISIMVAASCSRLAPAGTEQYILLAALLAIMVGVIQLLLGIFQAGFIVNFFSHAVISGFTSAAAIVIAVSQIKYLFGIEIQSHESVILTLNSIFQKVGEINPTTLMMGIIFHVLLLVLKKKWPRFPVALLLVILGTVIVYGFNLESKGVSVVGWVPTGLPSLAFPAVDLSVLMALFPGAIAITLVGFTESIAIAEFVASRKKYRINSNQEFRGLGVANILAGCFSGYPVTGGFSRTAVNFEVGARTGLSAVFTCVFVLLTLVFFTPLFSHLPKVVLAAIVMASVTVFIDWKEAIRLWKLKRADGMVLIITFLITLLVGIKTGIILGVIISLLLFIWRSAHPHIAELGYLEKEDVFRNIDRFDQAKIFPHVVILRIDASMYFANMGFIKDFIKEKVQCHPDVKWVVFDLSGVNDIDGVAISKLDKMIENYCSRGIKIALASMKGPVRDIFNKEAWYEKHGRAIVYPSVNLAIDDIVEEEKESPSL